MATKTLILSVRTPSGVAQGFERFVGKTITYTGNAYHGFYFTDPDKKEVIDLIHFFHRDIKG